MSILEKITIGGQVATPPPTRPLTYLPARLDAAACLKVLAQIDPEVSTETISAARTTIDVERVDSALEYTGLSVSDRIRFKYALGQNGLLSVGKKA